MRLVRVKQKEPINHLGEEVFSLVVNGEGMALPLDAIGRCDDGANNAPSEWSSNSAGSPFFEKIDASFQHLVHNRMIRSN